MEDFLHKIPKNYQGNPVNLVETKVEENLEAALKCFERAKMRLLNPPIWHIIAGGLSAVFKIENSEDQTPERLLKDGDLMSINIHSPDAVLAGNFDWVQVKEITEEKISEEEAYFLLRLEVAPNSNSKKKHIDHFFKKGASSSFVIHRNGNNISALYFGRNEEPNTEKENSILENVRNELVALSAIAAFSSLQWKALLNGLLQAEL